MSNTWDWRTNNAMKTCSYCGQPNHRVGNSMSVGMCSLHHQMWVEDIAHGLTKRNRLRDIMVERGQCQAKGLELPRINHK